MKRLPITMVKLSALAAVSGLLSNCAPLPPPTSEDAGPPPPDNYRAIIAGEIRADYFDPFTLQDVWISEPQRTTVLFEAGWIVCLRANGKNRQGAYSGRQETGYFFKNGAITVKGDYLPCPTVAYTEWPEMENIGSATRFPVLVPPVIAPPAPQAPAPATVAAPRLPQRTCTPQEAAQKRIAIQNNYTLVPNCQ